MTNSRLAICLFQDTITDFNRAELMTGTELIPIPLTQGSATATLYIKQAEPSEPGWVDIVSGFAALGPFSLKTSTSGAILFLKVSNRILACCFGTSVAYVNKNNIETDFGLGVTYDQMIPHQTKSMQSWTLADNPITSARSAALPTNRFNFNIDKDLESIIELSGYRIRNKKRISIKGKEFFSMTSPQTLSEIVDACSSCLDSYKKSIADNTFKALTSIRKIKDRKLIDRLDQKLCSAVKSSPGLIQIVDYENLEGLYGYKLTPKTGDKLDEINSVNVLNKYGTYTDVHVDLLKARNIYPVGSDDQIITSWPLYKCLFFTDNESKSVLYKGKWYDIDIHYLRTLESFIDSHQSNELSFPKWNKVDGEGKYNIKAAKSIKGQCWDKNNYNTPEFNYSVEFCDILYKNNIIHVKKKSSSSLSSHLLMQTAVSAQLLSTDPRIKNWIWDEMVKKFSDRHLLKSDLTFEDENVNYHILLLSGRTGRLSQSLPFFSLISFNMVIKKILSLGYNVRISQA